MEEGIIISLGNGFGYVRSNDQQEFFFHVSALKNCEFKELKANQRVVFVRDHEQPNVIAELRKHSA